MKRKSTKKYLIVFTGVAVFSWVVYALFMGAYMKLETQVAAVEEFSDSIEAVGITVRDEFVLEDDSYKQENLKYLLSDGQRVAKNGPIAEVYSDAQSVKTNNEIENINKEIEVLEKLSLSYYSASKGINFTNKQINSEINMLLNSLSDNNIKNYQASRRNLVYLLNERQILLGRNIDFESKISDLEQQKENLLKSNSKSSGVVKSSQAGVFIKNIDGFENKIDYKNILNSDFNDLEISDFEQSCVQDNNNAFGKIIKSETWYIVCKVADNESLKINEGNTVKVDVMSFDFTSSLPCKVEKVVDGKNAYIILSCDYMSKDLAYMRKENFKIILNEHQGFKVPKSAVHHFSDGSKDYEFGVYVKINGRLRLRKVTPVFWGETYVICSCSNSEVADESYLQIGDNIVVKGIGLYENKYVD